MNKYFQSAKNFLKNLLSKDVTIGILVMVGFVAIVVIIVTLIQNAQPKIVYQPAVACELLTEQKAKEMLGDQVLHQNPANPTLQNGVATSKCAYTDVNPEQNQMKIAAVAVRSGVDDKGTAENKAEFAAAKSARDVEVVKNVGDSAFFNPKLGQLNVLKGRDWIIVSYGTGSDPQSNTLADAIELSQKVLTTPQLPTF